MTTAAPAPSGRDLPHPACEQIRLESVLHALSDPMRLQVVR
ncbi:transcriptional regulator, partial [Streptomyces sp. NPDC060187]